jgi:hypothetical protein
MRDDKSRKPASTTGDQEPADALPRGYTVADVARRLRVSKNKVLTWINRGELAAINTAAVLCGKPRWVISPDGLAAFERQRAGGPPPKPTRRRRPPAAIDYYPDQDASPAPCRWSPPAWLPNSQA